MSCILHNIVNEGNAAREVLITMNEVRCFLRMYLDMHARGEDLRDLRPGAQELYDKLKELLVRPC